MTTTTTKKRLRSRPCICNHPEQCRGMSLAFQMLTDPRGNFVEVPAAYEEEEALMEFWHRMNALRQAYFLTLNVADYTSSDSQALYVALHHFAPALVRQLACSSNSRVLQVPPTITLGEARRLGLPTPKHTDLVYNAQGQTIDDCYFVVPDYPLADAHEDLKQLSKAERSLPDVVADVYQNAKKAIEEAKKRNGKHHHRNGDAKASNCRTEKRKKKEKKRAAADGGDRTVPTEAAVNAATTKSKPPDQIAIETKETSARVPKLQGTKPSPVSRRPTVETTSSDDNNNNNRPAEVTGTPSPKKESQATAPQDKTLDDSDATLVNGSSRLALRQLDESSSSALAGSLILAPATDPYDSKPNPVSRQPTIEVATTDAQRPAQFKGIGTPKKSQKEIKLGDSNGTLVNGASLSALRKLDESSDLGASHTTTIGLHDSSAASLQVTALMQASSSSSTAFHASDLTVRASGSRVSVKQLNASDTTVQASNITTPGNNSGGDISAAKRQIDLDFPFDVLPPLKRCSDHSEYLLPLPPPLPPAAAARFASNSSPNKVIKVMDSSPMTPKRMVSRRSLDSEEEDDDDDDQVRKSLNLSEDDDDDEVVVAVPPRNNNNADQAPSSPTRTTRKQSILPPSVDLAPSSSKRKRSIMPPNVDLAPSSPQRKQSIPENVEKPQVQKVSASTTPPTITPNRIVMRSAACNRIIKMSPVKEIAAEGQEEDVTNHSSRSHSKDESRRLTLDTIMSEATTMDAVEAPARRRVSKTQLALLDKRRVTSFHRREESSQEGNSLKTPPARSWSGDSTCLRRRSTPTDDCGPTRSKSDSSAGKPRRRSDVIDASVWTGKSLLGASRCYDTTFRAMQHFSEQGFNNRDDDADVELQHSSRGRRRIPPRRFRSEMGRSKSGDELPVNKRFGANTRRTPRRTKSVGLAAGKRGSNPSPVRRSNKSPRRGVRRTKSVDMSPDRITRRSRTRNSPARTRSGLSPIRSIKRLDTTKRAMKQFIHDTGTGSADRSPRRSPRRTRSRKRSFTPTRSPIRNARGLKLGSDRDLNYSSPTVMGGDAKVRLQSSLRDMNASSPGIMTGGARTESCPALNTSNKGSNKNTLCAAHDDNSLDSTGQQPHTPGVKSAASSSAVFDPNEDVKKEEACQSPSAAKDNCNSTPAENSNKEIGDAAVATLESSKAVSLSEYLHAKNIESNATKAKGSEESLQLEELAEAKAGRIATAPILADFNFSYPLPTKSERKKDVDWESIGFYASFSALPEIMSTEEETGSATLKFGLPWRLVAKKARQQLLTELVVTAHRRQTVAAKKQSAVGSAMRRETQMVMKEMLAAIKEMKEEKMDFGEHVAKTAGGLFEGDRAGQLDASTRRTATIESSLEQGESRESLTIDQVFEASQKSVVSQTDRLTGTPQKSLALDESAVSLSLRRVFEDSERSLPNGSDFEKSGSWGSEQLRAVFPFKTLRERKRGSSRVTGESCLSADSQDQPGHRVEKVPPLPERPAPQTPREKETPPPSPVLPMRRQNLLVEGALPETSELLIEKLPDISEEVELEKGPGKHHVTHEVEASPSKVSRPDSSSRQDLLGMQDSEGDLPQLEPMTPTRSSTETAELFEGQHTASEHLQSSSPKKPNSEFAPNGSEQKELDVNATESIMIAPVPLDVRAKMDALLHEERNEKDASLPPTREEKADHDRSLPLNGSKQARSSSTETCDGEAEEPPVAEFHLSFDRSLPPTGSKQARSSSTETCDDEAEKPPVAEFHLSFPPPTGSNQARSSSTETCDGEAKEPPVAEFHLSFPTALALGSRALPPTTDICLTPTTSPWPGKGHSRPTTVNNLCDHDKLDKKINLTSFQQEIQFVPSVGSFNDSWRKKSNGSKLKRRNEAMEKRREIQGLDPLRRSYIKQ